MWEWCLCIMCEWCLCVGVVPMWEWCLCVGVVPGVYMCNITIWSIPLSAFIFSIFCVSQKIKKKNMELLLVVNPLNNSHLGNTPVLIPQWYFSGWNFHLSASPAPKEVITIAN